MVLGDEAQPYAWNTNLQCFDKYGLSGSSQDNPFSTGSFFDNHGLKNDICVDSSLSGNSATSSRVSEVSWVAEANSTPTSTMSTLEKGSGEWAPTADDANRAGWAWSCHLTPAQSLSAHKVDKKHSLFTNYPGESDLRGEIEDKLFMHYLDEVFYVQYPFYNSPHKQSRSWLFSTLRRVRSVYYATLALSQHHMQSMAENSLLPTLSRKINYRDVALQEMELSLGELRSSWWGGTASLVRGVECATCILQILFCEVRYTCISLNLSLTYKLSL